MTTEVIISLEQVQMSIGERILFTPFSLGVHALDKIGLIGINGCGKTTLLRLLSKHIEPDGGNIIYRNDLKVVYLPQEPIFNPESTIVQHVQANSDTELHQAEAIIDKLGLDLPNKQMKYLSGGQKRKADLARVLVQDADFIILDEPTNHLDLDTIEWLQNTLYEMKKTLIFVTHDRYFLDAVCNRIIEIDKQNLHSYTGSYSDFVKAKLFREMDNARKETRRKAQLKKELDWLSRGAKARTSKPKNHIDRVKELISKSYLIANAELDISFQTERLGKTILEMHKISKSYPGQDLFTEFDHNFQPLERIGIIGANGCGKTTMLKIILGEDEPNSGYIKVGVNTHFAYYKQDEDSFDPNLSVYDYVAQYAEVIKTKDGTKFTATEMLNRFLFDGKMQQMKLSALSGGERKRLYLLKSLMFGANFIILDEPTNDLDIRTLEILEDYLDAFDGCLIVVSHDRFFLDRTIDYLFCFEHNKIRKFSGNYSDYLLVKRYQIEETEEKVKLKVLRPKREKTGLTFNETRELGKLEQDIDLIEKRITGLEDRLDRESHLLNHEDYHNISTELETLNIQHTKLFERWADLSEKA
ncbi:MAG: ABC-F family ATP-binding cassette domain-containing protein [Candidatus Cloacimonetes bacterium]|nr:ABC-F family ATP-binding cassette domain-containing protein [Candidatus Cloacimonadota bacterium]